MDDALDFAFIFEDDAEIDPAAFAALVEFVTLERPAWDYVLLPAQPIRNGTPVASRGGLALLRPDAPPLRAIAQIVSLAAAKRLLDRTLPFDRPIDTLMQMTWVTGQPVLVASPSPVRDVSRETGGSTVQRKSMSLAERLRHEAMRPIYRAQVLARYRRHLCKRREHRVARRRGRDRAGFARRSVSLRRRPPSVRRPPPPSAFARRPRSSAGRRPRLARTGSQAGQARPRRIPSPPPRR